jgi:hypothetical protein
MPRKKVEKPVKKEVAKKPPQIFSDVEREIIRADMAYLIQKEKESGDWAKWVEDQKFINRGYGIDDPPSATSRLTPRVRLPNRRIPVVEVTGQITRERFIAGVGHEPRNDDLDRSNCPAAGTTGHQNCGWCTVCEKPRFMCGHWGSYGDD